MTNKFRYSDKCNMRLLIEYHITIDGITWYSISLSGIPDYCIKGVYYKPHNEVSYLTALSDKQAIEEMLKDFTPYLAGLPNLDKYVKASLT